MSQNELERNGGHDQQVTTWSSMNKDTSTNIKNLSFIGVHDICVENGIHHLEKLNLRSSLPSYPLTAFRENKSVDSGIPTLEISNPEPVHCILQNKRPSLSTDETTFQSSKTIPTSCPSYQRGTDHEHIIWKASTFPRSGYDTAKLYSPTSKTFNRSDDISDCSVSSLSTEFSTTLSVSNEDIVDFLVTSNSSAIVTLENDEAQFSDVTLNSTKDTPDRNSKGWDQDTDVDTKMKILGPLSNFFSRNIFARKKNLSVEKQNDLGWKLFGKVPMRDSHLNDSRKIQKEYEERIGRSSKSPSPKQNVRKSLVFEPLSTTALILEDRPA
ncbi:TBC1 domain family member 14 [Bombina bombina]|uniref:TBC1 domain family member 14 n=1 Tax=Bombina bombina TaxID=8345 RepID=UPI00235ACB2F|nr:TBC1 domain family member 14 [Bombina bombina]